MAGKLGIFIDGIPLDTGAAGRKHRHLYQFHRRLQVSAFAKSYLQDNKST